MSLLKRIESARPGPVPGGVPGTPVPSTGVPTNAGGGSPEHRGFCPADDQPGSGPRVVPGREVPDPEPRHLRPRPQARPLQPGRGAAPDRGHLRQGHRRGRPRPDPRRARPDARADHRRDHRPRAARAAPARREHHRSHGQRATPGLHRAGRQDRADHGRLPERRPRHADHRPDHCPDRPPRRRVEPDGRRPTHRRLPRERDHPAALADRDP